MHSPSLIALLSSMVVSTILSPSLLHLEPVVSRSRYTPKTSGTYRLYGRRLVLVRRGAPPRRVGGLFTSGLARLVDVRGRCCLLKGGLTEPISREFWDIPWD